MEKENKYSDDEIDLIDLFITIWKWKWLVIAVIVVSTITAFLYSQRSVQTASSLSGEYNVSVTVKVGKLYNVVLEQYSDIYERFNDSEVQVEYSTFYKNNKIKKDILFSHYNSEHLFYPLYITLSMSGDKKDEIYAELEHKIDSLLKHHNNLLNRGIKKSEKHLNNISDYTTLAMISLESYTYPTRVIGGPSLDENVALKERKGVVIIAVAFFASTFFAIFLVFFIEFLRKFAAELKTRGNK